MYGKISFAASAAGLAAALLLSSAVSAAHAADIHKEKGIACTVCHGPDEKNPQEPTLATCTGCHDVKALVEKTKNVKPANPHMSPHYKDGLECTNCHSVHGESENFCDQCHQFRFKVP